MLGALMPATGRSLRRLGGVTLVELMVTLAIGALLLAIALPSMRDFVSRKRLEGAAQELVTDLRFLKAQQLQHRRPMAISFGTNAAQTCYMLYFVGTNIEHCDCAAAADMCGAANIQGRPEQVRMVTLPRSSGLTLSSDRSSLKLLGYNALPEANRTLVATISSDSVGSARVSTNPVGLPTLCSVSGAYGSLPKCPP